MALLPGSVCLSHMPQPFVFALRMRSHLIRPRSRPPTPPPPLPVPPLAPPLTQPRALALSRRALTRLRRGLQLVTWYTDNCAVRCDGHSVMHDCVVLLGSIEKCMLLHPLEKQVDCTDLCYSANAVDAANESTVMFHCDVVLQCVTKYDYIVTL